MFLIKRGFCGTLRCLVLEFNGGNGEPPFGSPSRAVYERSNEFRNETDLVTVQILGMGRRGRPPKRSVDAGEAADLKT